MVNHRTLIALMVRVPVAGQVKTRLISALGAEGACRLYRAMVEDLLEQVAATALPLQLFFTGGDAEQLPRSWHRAAQRLYPQQGADLGARMAQALATGWSSAEKVVLIGSDIPGMTAAILTSAAEALQGHEVVLAPALDGGYCLLGLNRGIDIAPIFENMPWSTDQVLALTQQRLSDLGHHLHLLPPLRDIDTPVDLLVYRSAPNPAAHRVNRVLAGLSLPCHLSSNTLATAGET